jgi:hypothetical protein
MRAILVRREWLLRTLKVELPGGIHLVEYDGAGLGYEQVSVDGSTVIRGSHRWYVPRFEFELGVWPAVVEVRVWPWFALRSFALLVNDHLVYAEGVGRERSESTRWLQRLARLRITAHRS